MVLMSLHQASSQSQLLKVAIMFNNNIMLVENTASSLIVYYVQYVSSYVSNILAYAQSIGNKIILSCIEENIWS
jgi:hypothetical protein